MIVFVKVYMGRGREAFAVRIGKVGSVSKIDWVILFVLVTLEYAFQHILFSIPEQIGGTESVLCLRG